MENLWIVQIDEMLAWGMERESQTKFLQSVRAQIELNPLLYPTGNQIDILARMYAHAERIYLETIGLR